MHSMITLRSKLLPATVACIGLLLAACSHLPSPSERNDRAQALAKAAGWSPLLLPANSFTLKALVPDHPYASETLTIYLEGDGLAWLDESSPSSDPTPLDPLALRLALKHRGAVAYLGRPCQYVQAPHRQHCQSRYWTSSRFAPEVIDATSQALDKLKPRWGASQLVLVGYSGGGAVAALVAAQRSDVVRLITLAGNLDHSAWTKLKRLSPLTGSLNPADFVAELQRIPQWHLVGGRDLVMPPVIAQGYASRFSGVYRPEVMILDGFDHRCCWADAWTPHDPDSLVGRVFLKPSRPQ